MKQEHFNVLLVEDQDVFADLTRENLERVAAGSFHVTHVKRLREARKQLLEGRFDVVLLDLLLPDSFGLDTYTAIRGLAPGTPVVALTGTDDEELALEAVRSGAQDYLVKGQLDSRTLARAIRYAIERKRAQEALRQSEEFFRLISENVEDMVAVIGRDGRRIYNSRSYQSVLGDPNRLVGTDCFDEIHPDDRERIRAIFQKTSDTGEGQRTEFRFLLKDGSIRHIESVGTAILDGEGHSDKVVVVSRDITERKQNEQRLRAALDELERSNRALKIIQGQLIQAEKVGAVSAFASGVAHEVRNPLQTLALAMDYFSTCGRPVEGTSGLVLADMNDAVARIDAIVRGLVEFARDADHATVEGCLSRLIEEAVTGLDSALACRKLSVVKELASDLPPVRLDWRTLRHVFNSLLIHSIRRAPEGGTLTLRTSLRIWNGERSELPFVAGDRVVVAEAACSGPNGAVVGGSGVRDSGAAVRSEAGVGLVVLQKIVELHGGVLEHIDQPAGGKFLVLFKASGGLSP